MPLWMLALQTPAVQTEVVELLAAWEPVAQVAKVAGAGRSVCALQAKR